MRDMDQIERSIVACGLLALAASFAALAVAPRATAIDHMRALADMCIPGSGHCLACISAVSCLAAALVLTAWSTSQWVPSRARVAPRTARGR